MKYIKKKIAVSRISFLMKESIKKVTFLNNRIVTPLFPVLSVKELEQQMESE